MDDHRLSAKDEWRRGWGTVLAAAFGISCATLYIYSAGAFVGPIESSTGWSRTQIGGGITIVTLCATVFSPFVGAAIDRYGARRMALLGITLYPAAFAAIALTGSEIWSWYMSWAILGVVGFAIGPATWTTSITHAFDRSRGLALAVTLSGMGVGSLTIPVITTILIQHFGWRFAFLGLGLIWTTIGTPLVYFLLRDGDHRTPVRTRKSKSTGNTNAARATLLSPKFAALVCACFCFTFVAMSFVVSIIPILRWEGLDATAAAELASLFGVSAIVGRLFTGYLLDRTNARLVTAAAMSLPIFATLLLWSLPGAGLSAAIAILVMGLSLGAEVDAIAYLVSRYFGMSNYALLFGTTISASSIATALAPLVSGMIYDATGGYSLLLLIMVFPCMISSLAILTLGKQPALETTPPEPVAQATAMSSAAKV